MIKGIFFSQIHFGILSREDVCLWMTKSSHVLGHFTAFSLQILHLSMRIYSIYFVCNLKRILSHFFFVRWNWKNKFIFSSFLSVLLDFLCEKGKFHFLLLFVGNWNYFPSFYWKKRIIPLKNEREKSSHQKPHLKIDEKKRIFLGKVKKFKSKVIKNYLLHHHYGKAHT